MNEHMYKAIGETTLEYIQRLCELKDSGKLIMTWKGLAEWLNEQLDLDYSESYYRKGYRNGDFLPVATSGYLTTSDEINTSLEYTTTTSCSSTTEGAFTCDGNCDTCEDFEDCIQGYEQYLNDKAQEIDEKTLELRKERMKLSDERVQNNAYLRRISREETLKEIALEYAEKMNSTLRLPLHEYIEGNHNYNEDPREGILLLSDWHYGMICDNPWNKFDTDICRDRVNTLLHKVISKVIEEKINKVTILNLSDLIAGRIHTQIRIQSRVDVVTQTMEVAEILAEFICALSKYCNIDYYDCLDNHSRIEANKKESMDLESLARMIPWYLAPRLKKEIEDGRVRICENEFGPDIITCTVLGHKVIGVHGDHDSPTNGLDKLTLMTHRHYDLFCTAHRHHMFLEEKNHAMVVGNSSLMGTDSYAEKLRLSADPSQTFIIATPTNACEEIHRILVR